MARRGRGPTQPESRSDDPKVGERPPDDPKAEDLRERYIDQTGTAPPDDGDLVEGPDGRIAVDRIAGDSDPAELDRLDDLANPHDAASLPDLEEDITSVGRMPLADRTIDGGIKGPSLTGVEANAPGVDEDLRAVTDDFEELEEFLAQDRQVGGLDGRNPVDDGASSPYGTGAGDLNNRFDPIGNRPGQSLDGAAGDSLHEVRLDKIKAIVNDPDMSGDEKVEALDQLADQVHEVGDGASGTPGSAGGSGGTPPPPDDSPPGEGHGTEGEHEGGSGSDIVDWVADALGYDSSKFWGDAGEAGKTGGLTGGLSRNGEEEGLGLDGEDATATQAEVEASAEKQIDENDNSDDGTSDDEDPPAPDPAPEAAGGDMTPEQETPIRVWSEFTDEYQEQQTAADLGADVDYGDQVQGESVGTAPMDSEPMVADYEEGYVEPTVDVAAAHDVLVDAATPDEEFMDT